MKTENSFNRKVSNAKLPYLIFHVDTGANCLLVNDRILLINYVEENYLLM